MTSANESYRRNLPSDFSNHDPAQLFIPGPVVSDEDEFGTLISATVADEFVTELGLSKVFIRILPIGYRAAIALRGVVHRIRRRVQDELVLQYIGVWEISSTETWLVSERRRIVSLRILFASIQSYDVESVVSYIARICLASLQKLHDGHGQPHTNLRPSNIYLSEECVVCFGDVGIYGVLSEHFKSRRSLPGVKLWPHPGADNGSVSSWQVDIWDLGMTILELVDGGAFLARMWRSGRRMPRLVNPSRWSAQLNSFLSLLFKAATEDNVARDELLLHRFVLGSSSSACRAILAEYMTSREELIAGPYVQETIGNLFRQNAAVVRAPLISIDDISTDQFSYEYWNGVDQTRPTVEKSLLRILRVWKEQPKPRDAEENKSLSRTIATVELFLETADML